MASQSLGTHLPVHSQFCPCWSSRKGKLPEPLLQAPLQPSQYISVTKLLIARLDASCPTLGQFPLSLFCYLNFLLLLFAAQNLIPDLGNFVNCFHHSMIWSHSFLHRGSLDRLL